MKRFEIAAGAALLITAVLVPLSVQAKAETGTETEAEAALRCTFNGETVEWPEPPLPKQFAEKNGIIECRAPGAKEAARRMEISGGKPVLVTEQEEKVRTDRRYSPQGVKAKEVRYEFNGDMAAWHVARERTFDDAGRLVRDFRYEAGRPSLDENFDAEGKLREKAEYRKSGTGFEIHRTRYHENGALAANGMFLRKRGFASQLPQGSFKYYDLRGQLMGEQVYDEDGALVHEREWDASGKLIRDQAIEAEQKSLVFKKADEKQSGAERDAQGKTREEAQKGGKAAVEPAAADEEKADKSQP